MSSLTEASQIPNRPGHRRLRAVVVGVGLLLVSIGLFLQWAWRPPVVRLIEKETCVYHRHGGDSDVSIYTLAGEFQEHVNRARAELLARGFRENNRGDGDLTCEFARGDYSSRIRTIVVVRSFAFAGATSDSIIYRPRPGCISVEVQHIRRPVLEYLPVRWQHWYQLHFRPGKAIRLVEPVQPGKLNRPRGIRVLPPGTPLPPGGRRQPIVKDPNNR